MLVDMVHRQVIELGAVLIRHLVAGKGLPFVQAGYERLDGMTQRYRRSRREPELTAYPFEIFGRSVMGVVEAIAAFDIGAFEPAQRSLFLTGADRDDGLHPWRIQERIAQIIAVELQDPAERAAGFAMADFSVM